MLKLSHHKPTSRGYVTHERKRYYVPGRWPRDQKKAPPEVEAAYRFLVRKLLGDPTVADMGEHVVLTGEVTVAEMCSQYLRSCKVEEDPRTYSVMKSTVRALVDFSPSIPAKDFGPLKLQAFRDHLIRIGYDRVKPSTGETTHHEYTRSGINYFTKRVRKIFRWAVTQEIITADRAQALHAVLPLRQGRTKAPEAREIRQVPDEVIAQTLPHLPPPIAAMVRVQRLTAMRPGEICALSMPEIDRTDPECWVYTPKGHKTAYLGKHRVIVFGAEAQAVLTPWLRDDDKPLFSPAERMAERKRILRENRKSPVQPSQLSRAKDKPDRTPGDKYTTYSYSRVIAKACKAHGIPQWSPNQVRKRAGQWILESEGAVVEDAAAILGNDPEVARRIYLQGQTKKAKRVMLRVERDSAKNSPRPEIPQPPGG